MTHDLHSLYPSEARVMPSRRIEPEFARDLTPALPKDPVPLEFTKPTLPRFEANAQINKPLNAPADYVFHSDSSARAVRVLGDVSKDGRILTGEELDQLRTLWNTASDDMSTAEKERLEYYKSQLRPQAPYDLRNRPFGGEPKSFTDWPIPPPEKKREEVITWLRTVDERLLWNLDLDYFNAGEQGYINNCRNDSARRAREGSAQE